MQNHKTSKIILAITSFIFTIILTIFIDRLAGWVLPHTGLIFPPNTTVTYKTTEFEFVAHINNLGFRGGPVDPHNPQQKFRIMTLGDSFTYGWGVDEEGIWSTLIAKSLEEKGFPTEIVNMGWPGKGPSEYADIAEKAILLLKPDLVVVAILQGDDLQQLQPTTFSLQSIRRNFRKVYPNFTILILQGQQFTSKDLQHTWQRDAAIVRDKMTSEELAHFKTLDPEIREFFGEGLLSPHLVSLGIRNPDYFLDVIDTTIPQTQAQIDNLTVELERIKRVASANEAEVVVVAVPYGTYVNEHYIKNIQRFGFRVNSDRLLSFTSPDDTIAIAAERAGLKFISVLDSFRQSRELLFYNLDTHFTAAGNKLFAENLLPFIEEAYQCHQSRKICN